MIGTITGYGDNGYHWLIHDDGSGKTFVHISDMRRSGIMFAREGDELEFDVVERQGRTRAANLRRID